MIKNHFISRTIDRLKFYRLSVATFYDCITNIYQFIKYSFDNQTSIFEECGVFKAPFRIVADEILFLFYIFENKSCISRNISCELSAKNV